MPLSKSSANSISIHALREEGDLHALSVITGQLNFNPRPPRGGRPLRYLRSIRQNLFQSTPSARRATNGKSRWLRYQGFQSTPSARRATLRALFMTCSTANFNPRPPRGGRRQLSSVPVAFDRFQSTPSARRATLPVFPQDTVRTISIHALREEGDCSVSGPAKRAKNFNPRPPRGGRPTASDTVQGCKLFQSTPSARRATQIQRKMHANKPISIHALREEGDFTMTNNQIIRNISIHALREEGDPPG